MHTLIVGLLLLMVGCSATPRGPTTGVYVGKDKNFTFHRL
jgi:hypothetical protein